METVECQFCTGIVPAHAQKCKHCGEWLKEPPQRAEPAPRRSPGPQRARDEREDDRATCQHCNRKMVPRIITGPPLIRPTHGWTPVPKRSVCPYCGGTHMKFPASAGEKVGLTIFLSIFAAIFAYVAVSVLSH